MLTEITPAQWGPEAQDAFTRNGYLVLRAAFLGQELNRLRIEAQQLREQVLAQNVSGIRYWWGDKSQKQAKNLGEQAQWSWGVNEVTRQSLFRPALIDVLGHAAIDQVLNGLLQEPRAWGLKVLWAPQRSHYQLGWHQDLAGCAGALAAWKPSANDHVQFNLALNDDASFMLIPGSHRRTLAPDVQSAIANDRTVELPSQLRVHLAAGDVVFMDAHAWHRGECPPGAARLSLHYSCQAQWVPLAPWGRAEDFAWICSQAFRDALSPRTRPYYERLSSAVREVDQLGWLKRAALQAGYRGPLPEPLNPFGEKDPYA